MRKSRSIPIALVILMVPVAIYLKTLADVPDFEFQFTRNIPSKLSPDYLDQVFTSLRIWPSWIHAGQSAIRVDSEGVPLPKSEQVLLKNEFVRLKIDPKNGIARPFEITVQVMDYVPKKRLELRVLSDSKNRLTKLFDSLQWVIELTPNGSGSWIRGQAIAHTHHWRARILGKLVPTILLNQVFYPDLLVMAEINKPEVVYPDPDSQHGGM
jgi:hypothetical protein